MGKGKAKKLSKLSILVIVTLTLVASGMILYKLAHSMSVFDIRSVEVSGNSILPRDRVLLYSGIAIGDNIFEVDSKEVEMNLKSDPYVRSVDVSKNLPSGIHLLIEENKDVVVIDVGKKIYLSQDGIVLSKSDDFRGYFVPSLEGLLISDDIVVSSKIEYEGDFDQDEFLSFLKGLSKLSIHNRLSHIKIEEDMVKMYLSTGEEIVFGEFKDVDYKFNYLETILTDLQEKSKYFEKIDFTRGNRVIVEEKIFGKED